MRFLRSPVEDSVQGLGEDGPHASSSAPALQGSQRAVRPRCWLCFRDRGQTDTGCR